MREGRIKKIDPRRQKYNKKSIIRDGNEYQGFMPDEDIRYNQHLGKRY